MSNDWQPISLGDALSFSNGASSPERNQSGSIVVFGSNGPIGLADEENAPANTIVIGRVGSYCGSLQFSKQACWVTDNAIKATAKSENSPLFLFYLLQTLHLNNWRGGSGQPLLNQRTLSSIPTKIPSPDTQRAIADLLSSLDDKIEQNRRTGSKLEGLARAVFKAWFVDFEPVKAKAAGATAFPGMPPEAFATLPTRFTNSALGPVPEGWELKLLEDVAEAVKGLSYKGAGLVPPNTTDGNDWLPLHNLNSVFEGGGYKNEGIKRYRGKYKDRHVIYPGDLIVTNTEQGHEYRLIGFPAIVPKRFGDRGLFSHHLFRVRPLLDSPIGVQFLYFAIMSSRIREEIVGCTNGTTVNMLSVDGLKRPRICIPPSVIANVFEQQAATMYELSESFRDESAKLAALRDYLLPRLLSGRVRVKEAQRDVNHAY